MVESKVNPSRRLGFERMKYLDMANLAFAEQNWIGCRGYLDAFLETIREDTATADKIKQEFDVIEQERKEQKKQLEDEVSSMGFLEQRDMMERGNTQIEMEYVHSQKTVCWKVAITDGLFNE